MVDVMTIHGNKLILNLQAKTSYREQQWIAWQGSVTSLYRNLAQFIVELVLR